MFNIGEGAAAQSTELQKRTKEVAEFNQITFLTTDDFPYQTSKGVGASYEIMKNLIPLLNYSMDQIRFYPWARAFKRVKSGERNAAVFSMTRKPEREPHFDWCCYLYDGLSPQIIVRKDFKAGDPQDALSGKTAALWRGSAGVLRFNKLVKKGLKADFHQASTQEQIIKMLLRGRVDFIISFINTTRTC